MKTMLMSVLTAAAIGAFGGPGDLCFRFSSTGPDRYADGSDVLPGECYALVWTKDGAEFAGFAADGTAANPAESKVLIVAPLAREGENGMHCPNVLFQLDAALAGGCVGGKLEVCLLDTRKADGTKGELKADGTPVAINTYAPAVGGTSVEEAKSGMGSVAQAEGALGASRVTAVPPDTPQPRIKALRRVGDKLYLTVENTVPCLQYNATCGATPQTATTGGNAAEAPKNGVADGEMILVVPAKGDSGFYSVKRN